MRGESCLNEVIRIAGSFDPAAVPRILAETVALPRGSRVVLDFTETRDVSFLALCMLARALTTTPGLRIVQKGLARHHERILKYLGIDAVRTPTDRDLP